MAAKNDSFDPTPAKRIRIDEDGDQGIVTKTSITDLNIDCLEKMFSYLTVTDLLNVADSSKLLKKGAELAYSGKKLKVVEFALSREMISHGNVKEHLKDFFRILRCFGHLIPHLSVNFNFIHRYFRIRIEHYIAEYCADTLFEISIFSGNKNTFQHLKKSFTNVERVSADGKEMISQLSHFRKWFPKTIELNLFCSIELFSPSDIKNLKSNIQMNQQLQYLNIGITWNLEILVAISKLSALTTLTMHLFNNIMVHTFASYTIIHFEYVKKLKIIQTNYFKLRTKRLPLRFHQLEELTLYNFALDGMSLEFINSQPTLKKVTVGKCSQKIELKEDNIHQMKNSLPLLTELYLDNPISFDEASMIINILTSLKKFHFCVSHPEQPIDENGIKSKCDEFVASFGSQISADVHYPYFKLELERN